MKSKVLLPLLPLVLSACMLGPGATLGPTLGSPPGDSPTPTAASTTDVPTMVPTGSAASTPSTDVKPTPSFDATPSPAQPTPTATDDDPRGDGPPPLATIRVADGSSVVGQLGSWCYGMSCADAPAFPIDRLPKIRLTEPGGRLEIVMPEGARFTYWRASYTESIINDMYGITLGSGGDPEDATAEFETASFAGPPAGTWGLILTLLFANPDGDALYSWHALVPN